MSRKKNNLVAPVLKWVGGKRQLIPEIEKYFPDKYSTYYEPFIGGGAVLFNFQPKRAVVNDINEELINLYKVIKDDVESLIEDLKNVFGRWFLNTILYVVVGAGGATLLAIMVIYPFK